MSEQQTTIEEKTLASGVRLDVPFFGQYAQDVPDEWRHRVCGIVTLRMALAHVLQGSGVKIPSVATLIAESEAIKGWSPYGLSHDAIVRLAHNHGAPAYREEFRSVNVDYLLKLFTDGPHTESLAAYGRDKLRDVLKAGGIPIVSMTVDGRKDTHLIALVGFDGNDWFCHDPEYKGNEGAFLRISGEDFVRRFRSLVIFIGPRLGV